LIQVFRKDLTEEVLGHCLQSIATISQVDSFALRCVINVNFTRATCNNTKQYEKPPSLRQRFDTSPTALKHTYQTIVH